MEEIIIIGGGLSGLTTAFELKKKNISFKILEAQNRIGGRIETIYGLQNTPMEMGATWFSKEHHQLIQFLSEINIGYFEQYNAGISFYETEEDEKPQQYMVPPQTHSAYRIQGGTNSLIEILKNSIGMANIVLNTAIAKITDQGQNILITDSLQNTFCCKRLIIAIPPKLIVNKIQFSPDLPQSLKHIMIDTQTWMTGSIKYAVEYKKPFWKENGFSGSVFSQTGLATELYDHSNVEETKFALKGFLSASALRYTFEERKEKVITQLKNYFGNEAADLVSYQDKIWNDQYIQPDHDTLLPPHFNNGDAVFKESYMNNKLFFTGTETSNLHSGYMEGAIIAAKAVAHKVTALIKR